MWFAIYKQYTTWNYKLDAENIYKVTTCDVKLAVGESTFASFQMQRKINRRLIARLRRRLLSSMCGHANGAWPIGYAVFF